MPPERKITLLAFVVCLLIYYKVTTQSTNCRKQICDSCSSTKCDGFECQHQGTCDYGRNSSGYVNRCGCLCTPGFDGQRCQNNKMVSTYNSLNFSTYLGVQATVNYTRTGQDILEDQLRQDYNQIPTTLSISVDFGEKLISILESSMENRSIVDLQTVSSEFTEFASFFQKGIDRYGCTIFNNNTCKINRTDVNHLTEKSEENVVNMVNLMLEKRDSQNESLVKINTDIMSLTVIRAKGRHLNKLYDDFRADYGSLTLPYFESFQDMIGNDFVSINVMTYDDNPFIHLDNVADTVAGSLLNESSMTYQYDNTAPVVRLAIKDRKGFVKLKDKDDPIEVAIDLSKIYGNDEYFATMDLLNGNDGKSWTVANFNETVVEAYVVELKIGTRKQCEIWGKYGYSGLPDEIDNDMYIKTKGRGRIEKQLPRTLAVDFEQSLLKITVQNEDYKKKRLATPLTVVLRCEDDHYNRRRKRAVDTESNHQYRLSSIGGRCLDKKRTKWVDNQKKKCIQVHKASKNELVFKSTFFGSFSATAFVIGPSPIDFEDIFLNFSQRLAEAPHVLVTFVAVIVLGMLAVIPLRRADKRDKVFWTYLPLVDNHSEGYKYYLSFQTSTSSARTMSATAYIELVGTNFRTGPRVLIDGRRSNFNKGTSSHFILLSKDYLGKIKKLVVWHDNQGGSPRWLLSKVVLVDGLTNEKHVFFCGKWLSMDCEDGKTWRRLYPTTTETLDSHLMFQESSKKRFYDDFLWFSLAKRPHFSTFTRVQRMWTIISMLFLTMLTSAMWYQSADEQDKTQQFGSVKIGPFTFGYRQLYVGLASSVIALGPSFIVISIFRNRRLREETARNRVEQTESSTSNDKNNKIFVKSNTENKLLDEMEKSVNIFRSPSRQTKQLRYENKEAVKVSKSWQCYLPWWTIFIAYALLILCTLVGGTITFMYTLDFGKEKTNNWFLAFLFGTAGSICVIEPVKAVLIAALIACCLKGSAEKDLKECPRLDEDIFVSNEKPAYNIVPCPNLKKEDLEVKVMRHRARLDRQLTELMRSWMFRVLYVIVILMIGSQNFVTDSNYQNRQLLESMNSSFQANSTEDIWEWIKTYYIPAIWTKLNAADGYRSAYEQRYLFDQCSYRLGYTRIRQVRTKGECVVDYPMSKEVTICKNDYSLENEARMNFCPEWMSFNLSCSDEDEELHDSFLYRSSELTKSLSHYGRLATYSGGGYMINLGPKQSLALDYVQWLQDMSWIDLDTRAVFLDTNSFNPNTRLFSHTKVVFELSEYGQISWDFRAQSSNLYPYVTAMDYVILGFQIIFCVLVCLKFLVFLLDMYHYRLSFYKHFTFWIDLVDLVLCITAPVCFIIRILHTVDVIEEIRNDKGLYVSFDSVEVYNDIYLKCLAGISFLAILKMLEPLTFNYYLFVLQRTLVSARTTLLSYLALAIVCIMAFGCYLNVTVGYDVPQFKDITTSFLTLLQLLLAMISFRGNLKMQSIQAQAVVAIYALVMTLVMLNLFITALTMTFDEIKKIQKGEIEPDEDSQLVFNKELNNHFWVRLHQMIKACFRKCFPERVVAKKDKLKEHLLAVEKMINKLESMRLNAVVNEQKTAKVLAEYARCLFEQYLRSRILLECVATRNNAETKYSFVNPRDGQTKITIVIPFKSCFPMVDMSCYEIDRNFFRYQSLLDDDPGKLRSEFYQFIINRAHNLDGQIYLRVYAVDDATTEYDATSSISGDKWMVVHKQENEDFVLDCIPRNIVCVAPTNCKDPQCRKCSKCPIEVTREPEKKQEEGINTKKMTFETHTLSANGCVIRMKCDPRIEVVIEPRSVENDCSIEIGMRTSERNVFLFLKSESEVTKPISVTIPTLEQVQKTGDLIIVSKKGSEDWTTVNSVLSNLQDRFSFKMKDLSAGEMVEVFVKKSIIHWVEFPWDKKDTRVVKSINVISRYRSIAKEWKRIAEQLSISLDPDANGEDLRLSNPAADPSLPLCREEKCFLVLYKWYLKYPDIDVEDLRNLVSSLGFKQAAGFII